MPSASAPTARSGWRRSPVPRIAGGRHAPPRGAAEPGAAPGRLCGRFSGVTDPADKTFRRLVADWEKGALSESLRRAPERRAEFRTDSGIPIERVYTALDGAGRDDARDLGLPGQAPFTRGVQATMYR